MSLRGILRKTEREMELADLSAFPHELRKVDLSGSTFGEDGEVVEDVEEANVFTSRVASGIFRSEKHTLALDLDLPAKLVPSTTPGHSHLYVDVLLDWPAYERVLEVLADVGVIERGFADASKRRGWSSLRLPWIKKQPGEGSSAEEEPA